ncbi:MAG TPA: enolase C-terminal domain-like protein [bacterium]|nr:enolase C-terminal domain-like protein [bacterium]
MRITALEAIPVAVPDPPLRNSWGVHAPYFLRTILRLRTDEGLTGLSETYGPDAVTPLELDRARQVVVGQRPSDVQRFALRLGSPAISGAIEVACLDLIGRATGSRVCDLLGGPVRDRVAFSAYLFFKYAGEDGWGVVGSPDEMVGLADQFVERFGFTTLKVKGGVLPPLQEIDTMMLLRRRFGPDVALRLDPNAVWSVETSLRVAYELGRSGVWLEYLEDPTEGIAGMARVRERVTMPLATNMCVTRWEDIAPAVDARAVDVILSDHHAWGGLRACQDLGRICATFHLGIGMHSNSHLGISMAAMIHLASVVPTMAAASDTHYPWLTKDILAGGPFRFDGGTLSVPAGPGLGVELDDEQVAEYHEAYQRGVVRRRDDTAEAIKREPGWLPIKPRW